MSDLFVEHRYFKFHDEIQFYRTKHGIAIACRPSVCRSVHNVGGSGSQKVGNLGN